MTGGRSVTWLEWTGAGGISIPLLFLAYYALRRTRSAMEMCLTAYLQTRAEPEQRATMIAMAAALPDQRAIITREAA
jgi:hypothetical protein